MSGEGPVLLYGLKGAYTFDCSRIIRIGEERGTIEIEIGEAGGERGRRARRRGRGRQRHLRYTTNNTQYPLITNNKLYLLYINVPNNSLKE